MAPMLKCLSTYCFVPFSSSDSCFALRAHAFDGMLSALYRSGLVIGSVPGFYAVCVDVELRRCRSQRASFWAWRLEWDGRGILHFSSFIGGCCVYIMRHLKVRVMHVYYLIAMPRILIHYSTDSLRAYTAPPAARTHGYAIHTHRGSVHSTP